MNLNVRKGDNVKVLTGKDKGKTGKVLATDPKTGKVLVEGVNIATHHLKARAAGQQSSIKKVEAPLDGSNVQIVCPSCNKNARVRHQKIDGKNVRICAKCGEPRRFRQGGQKEESRQNGQGEKARQEKGGRQSGKGRKDRYARGRRRGGDRSDRGGRRKEACGEKTRSQEARG